MACACLHQSQKGAEQSWLHHPARIMRLAWQDRQGGLPLPARPGCQLAAYDTLCPAPLVPLRAHSLEAPHLGTSPGLLAGMLQLLLACSGWK